MKDENERAARLYGSCASEGNVFAGNSVFLLKKKKGGGGWGGKARKRIPKRIYFVYFLNSDGFLSCKLTETPVGHREMSGERGALATYLRCRESQLELLQSCLG